MSENKTQGQELSEKLSYKSINAWNKISDEEVQKTFTFCDEYKDFLNKSKTEREFIRETLKMIKGKGFVSIDDLIKSNTSLKQGMKIYRVSRNK
ncbi:MAG: aminopeptidase, partial [Bacillota bacterium]